MMFIKINVFIERCFVTNAYAREINHDRHQNNAVAAGQRAFQHLFICSE